MSIRKIESIRKRDGAVVPYDEMKIAETISRAARGSGQEIATVGRDLASVVTMYLERYRERETPTSEEIRRLVEKILFDTGHGAVARSYIVHRERKGRPEAAAAPPPGDLFPSNLLLVDGATSAELAPWGREKIIAALTKEAALEEESAREIAGAVEQKVFRLGQRRVSTSLIRELVNHELLERGFASKRRRQIVVGLPKYDLARMVGDEEPRIDPEGMCRAIGQTTLKQYALQEIFSRDVADAHIEGRIHLHGLEEPLKLHSLSPSVAELRRTGVRVRGSAALSEPARDARTLAVQLGCVVEEARRHVHGPVTFPRLSEACDAMLHGADEDRVRTEIEHLAVALGGSRVGVDPRHRTAPGLAGLGGAVVTVSVPGEELREFCRLAADRGMLFAFERPSSPPPARGWAAAAHAVTINLPQTFYRGEAGSEFYAELENALGLAVKAHQQKCRLLRKFADPGASTFGLSAGWVVDGAGALAFDRLEFSIGLAGLNEAVRLLSGEEIHEGDAAVRLALRIVSYVFLRVREEAQRTGLRISLEDLADAEAVDRMARIDAQMYPRARGLLADRTRYAAGFRGRGGPSFEALAVEARFHTLVPSARAGVERGRLSPADLFAVLSRLHAETPAAHLAVE